MSSSGERPLARSEDLIVERLPGETLIYDEDRDEMHCLSGLAAAVFELCDGARSPAEIAALAAERLSQRADEAAVGELVAELHERHLLVGEPAVAAGLSRRQVIRKGALAGAGAVLITTIAAPSAVAANSATHCTSNSDCPAGQVCSNGRQICCVPNGGPCDNNTICCGAVTGHCASGSCVHG